MIERQSFLNWFLAEECQIILLEISRDLTILDCSDFCIKLAKHNPVGKKLDFILIGNIGLPELDKMSEDFKTFHLININLPEEDLPLSFYFFVKKWGEKFILLGQESYDENNQLKNDILGLNNQLNNMTRELNKKNKDLKKMNELKNQFLGIAAHDLRNPIGVISTFSNFLLDDAKENLNNEQLGVIEKMRDSSTFMLNLLDDLLDITKIEAGKIELKYNEINLTELINKIVELNSLKAKEKNIKINFSKVDPVKSFFVDDGKFEQVLNNLLSNAIKYSAADTAVSVNVFLSDIDAVISVKDSGQGIPKDEIGKLFQAYQTTSVQSTAGEKSTGLGLAIVQKIMIAHGGKIWVESEVGVGSTFYISLPISNDRIIKFKESLVEVKSKNEEPSKIPDNFFENIKVLVGEDDLYQQKMMEMFLKDKTPPPTILDNGQKVVDLVKEETFDIIFMDEQMPGLTGIEAIKKIREFEKSQDLKRTPIISLSASNESEIFIEAGADKKMKKPITKSQLLDVIYSFTKKT